MSPNSSWRNLGNVTPEFWRTQLVSAQSPIAAEWQATYEAAHPHTVLALAMMEVESRYATRFNANKPENRNPLNLRPPAGDGYLAFASYADAVRAWRERITDPRYKGGVYDKTVTILELIERYAPANDSNDPSAYAAIVAARASAWRTDDAGTVHSEGVNAQMAWSTPIPGLPGGPLITAYPIKFKLVPETQTRNRPGIPAKSPRRSIQHGNGNPNALAAADALYLFNGAEGRQASYHATSDDTEVWICIPLDEVTWQAADGAGPGNMNGLSLEMSEYAGIRNDDARLDKAITVAADFMGRCSARLNIANPERHWDFNAGNAPSERHHCPDMLMSDTLNGRSCWDVYAERWQASKADELARMNPQPKPVPDRLAPDPIWWKPGEDYGVVTRKSDDAKAIALLAEVTAKKPVIVRKSASAKAGEVERWTTGTKGRLVATHRAKNGGRWYFVEVGPGQYGRAPASSFLEKFPTV